MIRRDRLRPLVAPRGADRTGEVVGVWAVLAKLTGEHNSRFRCACPAGHERILYARDLKAETVCFVCNPMRRHVPKSAPRAVATPEPCGPGLKFCDKCYDIPSCRPEEGRCKCGGVWARDEITSEQDRRTA